MRQEAVAKATKELEADRERLANDVRSLRSQLEVAVSRNKQLGADRNTLEVGRLAGARRTGVVCYHRGCGMVHPVLCSFWMQPIDGGGPLGRGQS